MSMTRQYEHYIFGVDSRYDRWQHHTIDEETGVAVHAVHHLTLHREPEVHESDKIVWGCRRVGSNQQEPST